ncbi:MAG: hypothetical protein WA081_20050 [Desulfosalsimonadaceae bacterium]
MPDSFIATGRFIGIYPLRQFAPVIHGNHRLRAASQWAPHRRECVAFSGESICQKTIKNDNNSRK